MPTKDGWITDADDRRALNKLLDALAERKDMSDRDMSVTLFGLSAGAVSQWRTGRALPDDEQAAMLADQLQLNRAFVVAVINRQRAKSPVLKEMWSLIAEQFKDAAVVAFFAVGAGTMLAALPHVAEAAGRACVLCQMSPCRCRHRQLGRSFGSVLQAAP